MKRHYIFLSLLLSTLLCNAQKMSLEECIQMALQHNVDIRNAQLDKQMSNEDKAVATTKYFPSVNATATGFVGYEDLMRSEMELPAMMGGMAFPISMIKKGVAATITALQPLYAGGQIVNGNRLAALQQEIRSLQCQMTEKDVRQNVEEYFWKLVSLQGNVGTLDAVDEQLAQVHEFTNNYVEAGIINRNDLLRVELKQQEMASQRLRLNNGIELVRMMLAQLCGADMSTFQIQTVDISNTQSPDNYFVPADAALAQREEVELTQKAVRAGELQVKMERGKCLPTLAVGAAGMYYNVVEKNQGNLVGLATLSVPITDWWGGSHQIRKAKLSLQKSRNTMLDTQEKLSIDILNAWNNVQEAYAQIGIAQSSVEQAEENLRLSRNQYDAGTLNMTDLLDAITLFTQSRNNLISAQADYQNRLAQYRRRVK